MPEHGSPESVHTPMRVIALINQKGGVGKTTTTVNLAAGLAQLGQRVLIVDLDPQAHATLSIGVAPEAITRSIYDVLLDPTDDPAGAVVQARPNLAIIPAVTDLAAAEAELSQQPERHGRLAAALGRLAGQVDVVLIDCPPSLGLLTLNALVAAREVIIPMQAHFLALQGVSKLLETVQLVSQQLNPAIAVRGVVVCGHDAGTSHAQEVIRDLEEFFAQAKASASPWQFAELLRPFIRRNIKLAESPSFGQTIFEYAPGAPGAYDYLSLAKEVLDMGEPRRAEVVVVNRAAAGAPA